jgi:L-rhamnonate dehydratase
VAASPDGKSIAPVFGHLFTGEDVPEKGKLKVSTRPGFGMDIRDRSILKEFEG